MCFGLLVSTFKFLYQVTIIHYLQVVVYIAISAVVSYTKVDIVTQLHSQEDRDSALFLAGIVVQLGSLLGAVLFFFLVNSANIFHYY